MTENVCVLPVVQGVTSGNLQAWPQLSSQFLVLYQFAYKLHAEVACQAVKNPWILVLFSGQVAKEFDTVASMSLAM